MAVVDSCDGKVEGVCSISISPDVVYTDTQTDSQVASLNDSKGLYSLNSQMSLDSELSCQNHISGQMEVAGNDATNQPCIVDIPIEKGDSGEPRTIDKATELLKIEFPIKQNLQGLLQRQISMPIGKRFMQLLMNDNFVLPRFSPRDKYVAEPVHEPLNNNKTRKYKRSASFNSRKVAFLFSALSSLGTMILIFLTWKLRQDS